MHLIMIMPLYFHAVLWSTTARAFRTAPQRWRKASRLFARSSSSSSSSATATTSEHDEERQIMLRRDVETIAHAALQSVDPYRAVQEYVRYDDQSGCLYIGDEKWMPNSLQRVQIGAFGKAAAAMTAALVDVLRGTAIEINGICICKDGHVTKEQAALLRANRVDVYEASHPIPDERGVAASWKLLEMINTDHCDNNNNTDHDSSSTSSTTSSPTTLKICCISGGGSALFCTPICSLDDLRTTNERLLASGWDIIKINKVRKRLEHGKGGGLHADVALILSDVIGDPLDSIASGPTTVMASSHSNDDEDLSFVQELDLPEKVLEIIMSSAGPGVVIKKTDNNNKRICRNFLVGNNQKAVRAASDRARQLGYTVITLGTEIQGEAAQIGRDFVTTALNYQATTLSLAEKVAWIGGGETTVTLPQEHGLGGRNQELALSAAIAMQEQQYSKDDGLPLLMVASIGTDGTDGPTDAAGAIVDQYTVGNSNVERNEAKQALVSHDAYPYLKRQKALYTVRDKNHIGQCVWLLPNGRLCFVVFDTSNVAFFPYWHCRLARPAPMLPICSLCSDPPIRSPFRRRPLTFE
jgi:glycerate 2-kinase